MRKKLTVGILAHVDAGKTTLSEALLFTCGRIRSLGRVDHKNTYLDTNSIERERGITVYSKQARFSFGNCDFVLLDTPGHVDFSAETERTLSLLDYAILLISAPDGVQNHTKTLWQLLEHYNVPTFIFVNKTDVSIKLKEDIEKELCTSLSERCFSVMEAQTKCELDEKLAFKDESLLDIYMQGEEIDDQLIADLVFRRKLFPCLFGSALRLSGIEFLLEVIDRYTLPISYESDFGAKIYKISNSTSQRMTYLKITGGCLSARDEINYLSKDGQRFTEKIAQIRLYSGDKFEQVGSVCAGDVCTVTGLSATYIGQGLGFESDNCQPVLEPVLSYRIILPDGCDHRIYFPKLKEIEEEEPLLHLYWNEELEQIEARLMGEIQIDVLKRMISDRFGISCELDSGKILYKEKAASKAVGIGHFEPLRHYAEVQVLIEPQPKGTGLVFDTRVDSNSLATNWQRLILSILYDKEHRGILTGSFLTDTKITLIAGRAHLKHTEGGDFREATLRAVRHGLMRTGCTLLEPFYRFIIDVQDQYVGHAISDLQNRGADFTIEKTSNLTTKILGKAPVSSINDYAKELASFTRGEGHIYLTFDGYEPCKNEKEIVEFFGYDPTADTENTPHSVFCAHGAGFVVPWNEVESYKHIETPSFKGSISDAIIPRKATISKRYDLSDEELEAIMLREFGPIKRRRYSEPKVNSADSEKKKKTKISVSEHKKMLIVDGYNVIYSWDELKQTAIFSLEKAREELMDVLSSFVAYTKFELILVFDAYLVKDGEGSDFIRDGYRVVYTKQDQTADAFIEKLMFDLGPNYDIKVVTGDRLLQFSAVHSGVLRMTAYEFKDEVIKVSNEITDYIKKMAEQK